MNTLDKAMINAKIRMDLAKDAVCDKLFAKKNGVTPSEYKNMVH